MAGRDAELMWQPSAEAMAGCAMTRFMGEVAGRYECAEFGDVAGDYDALYRWSVGRRAEFWEAVWRFCGVRGSRGWDAVLEDGEAMPGARWFVGSRLNFAENLLRYRDGRAAILFADEGGRREVWSYAELYAEVARVSGNLRALGVGRGDRVAGYMANCPQAVVAMLASASIGAVWSSCSPDFGVAAVLERFAQIEPKVLFAVDGYWYNGRRIELGEAVAAVAEGLPTVERVVVVPFLEGGDLAGLGGIRDGVGYGEGLGGGVGGEVEFAQLPFDHPLYILYSSGTTGAPKCIVHSAGGTLLQHLKEHQLHTDIGRGDRLFYFTTCGWMMWNWLVSGLASGCGVVLYEGSPFFPRRGSLWELAGELGISVMGVSAGYLAAQEKEGVRPRECGDLKGLRAILSTGSPLAPQGFDYVYREVGEDLMLASISGGTDIVSCFVLGNPLRAVYRGEIQGRGLGMAVEVFDGEGRAVRGERGELVCTKAFPSMPLGFWGEEDGRRYRAAYFARFENVWAQGDYAEITARDGMVIHGRSDAALNPGGVRIGTAEIYRQVEKVDAVLESLCIAQRWRGDVRVVLFVVLREGVALDEGLKAEIRRVIQENTTRRHVPKKIVAVGEIPRTRSGKIVELAVRNVVHGEAVANTASLANPQALEGFRDLEELREE